TCGAGGDRCRRDGRSLADTNPRAVAAPTAERDLGLSRQPSAARNATLARSRSPRKRGGRRAPRAKLPRFVRAGDATGPAPVRGVARRRPACRHRRPRAAAVSRRAGTRAARPAARSAARRGGSGTRPLPAEVGLVAPRVCTARAGAHPAGEVPRHGDSENGDVLPTVLVDGFVAATWN